MSNVRVMITGASRGIGRAIAQSVLSAGYAAHLIARDVTQLERTSADLANLGDVSFSSLDLGDRAAVARFCSTWHEDLYGLINNAGYWLEDPVDALDVELFSSLLNVNLIAPYALTKGLLARIQDGGRIINIASQLGTGGRARMGAYSASKHALIGLTRCWAPEVAGRRITVNAVCPGWVDTASNRADFAILAESHGTTVEREMNAVSRQLVLRRFIAPEEVAALAAFLLGSGAGGITGQVYEIK